MKTSPFRAFMLSFTGGLIALFSAHSVISQLTYQPPEPPLQGPLNIPVA